MKEINIYSPCDGEIKEIAELRDGVFSEKVLGDGFYIQPSNYSFSGVFEKFEIIQIFDTKHAYFLKSQEGVVALMHIGLDTINFKGEPFNLMSEINKKYSKNDKLLEIKQEFLKEINFVTPVVFNDEEIGGFNFKLLKIGKVRQGDLIGKIIYNIESDIKIENKKNKSKFFYKDTAELLNKYVGSTKNYTNFYNCMTRLRINIINKEMVDIDKIKEIKLVKGIIWNGNELQVIFGGEVIKIKDEFEKFNFDLSAKNEIHIKKTFRENIFSFISGVMVPVIPVLMAAGLMSAIRSILIQTNLIENVQLSYGDNPKYLTDYDLFSGLIYILCQTGLSIVGIYFCYSTVIYLKGNGIMAIFVGITLSSHFLFSNLSWKLLSIGNMDIKIQAYSSSILPMIIAGFVYYYLDKWVKTWMPSTFDIVFRHLLVYVVSILSIFFILGPFLGLIELGVFSIVDYFGLIPFGIGTAILGLIWQMLVLTGIHSVIGNTVILATNSLGNDSGLYLTMAFAVMGQVGACIGVAIRTKNHNTKNIAYAAIPAGLFGITEPIIYSVNLPKGKPFIYGCIGGMIGGLLCGLFGLTASAVGGAGLLRVTSVIDGGWLNILLYFLICITSIAIALLLCLLFYKERVSEVKGINSIFKKIELIVRRKSDLLTSVLNTKKIILENFNNEIIRNSIKNFETNLLFIKRKEQEINKFEQILQISIEKINDIKKLKKLNFDKLSKLQLKSEKLKNKIDLIKKELSCKKTINKKLISNIYSLQNECEEIFKVLIQKINIKDLELIQANFYNAIHSVDITYELSAKKPNILLNKILRRINNGK